MIKKLGHAPDLHNPWRAMQKGNIACALAWLDNGPAMFLMPYPPKMARRGYVLPLSQLDKYVNADGTARITLTPLVHTAALQMGLDTTMPTLNLISDVVMLNVADLKSMPRTRPEPVRPASVH